MKKAKATTDTKTLDFICFWIDFPLTPKVWNPKINI